jgi:hypothetical protein
LKKKEKLEAEFWLGSRAPGWSARWRIALIATAVGFALTLPDMMLLNWAAGLAFAVSIGMGMPVIGGVWPATDMGRISGKLSPIFGCYPVSYWRAGWVMFKVNVVRIAAWVPLGLMMGLLGARTVHVGLAEGCWIVARGLIVLVAVMPLFLLGKFSKCTNDSSYLHWRVSPLLVVTVVVFCIEAMAVVLVIVAPAEVAGWSILAMCAVAWLGWWGYGRFYERGKMDLVRERQ